MPELDVGVRFFVELLGAAELYRLGPFDAAELPPSADGRDWTDAHLNVPGARVTLAMLTLPSGSLLELFHYERPDDAGRTPPRNCDVGGHHLAFEVEDLAAAARQVEERGLRVMAGPIAIEEGPAAGTRVQYFLAPWGLQLELVEHEPALGA